MKKNLQVQSRGRKFTLIELLMVVAIIAILASLLLPSLGRARETAKRISCAGQLKQLCTMTIAYTSDYKDFVMPSQNLIYGTNPYYSSSTITWRDLVRLEAGWAFKDKKALIFSCSKGAGSDMSYAYVYNWDGSYGMRSYELNATYPNGGFKTTQVKNPSTRIYLLDSGRAPNIRATSSAITYLWYIPGSAINPKVLALAGSDLESIFGGSLGHDASVIAYRVNDFLKGRHMNFVNTVFYDGHLEPRNSGEVGEHQNFKTSSDPKNMFNPLL